MRRSPGIRVRPRHQVLPGDLRRDVSAAAQYKARDVFDRHWRYAMKARLYLDVKFGNPGVRDIEDPRTGHSRRLRTGLTGWRWSSFCKTEYASRHGLDHFVRCHLCVVRMLDHAAKLGILASVTDEGDYWQKRDVQALAKEVGEWNENMAALVGQMKDLLGGEVKAPIAEFPDFEHLEMRGRRKKRK
jgi:hypothetical protein